MDKISRLAQTRGGFYEGSCALLNTKRDHNRECLRSLAVLKRVYSNEKDQTARPRENKRNSTHRRRKHGRQRPERIFQGNELRLYIIVGIIVPGNDHCARTRILGKRRHRAHETMAYRACIYFLPSATFI